MYAFCAYITTKERYINRGGWQSNFAKVERPLKNQTTQGCITYMPFSNGFYDYCTGRDYLFNRYGHGISNEMQR